MILDHPVPGVREAQAALATTAMAAVHIQSEYRGEISLPLGTLNSQTCHTSILTMAELRKSHLLQKESQNLLVAVSFVLFLAYADSKSKFNNVLHGDQSVFQTSFS